MRTLKRNHEIVQSRRRISISSVWSGENHECFHPAMLLAPCQAFSSRRGCLLLSIRYHKQIAPIASKVLSRVHNNRSRPPAHCEHERIPSSITAMARIARSPKPATRTNASLNLSVLQQHYPSTSQILTLAPFSVLYTFSPTTQSWEKCEVEGTLFVCALTPTEGKGLRYSVVILNRKGLDNFYLEIGDVDDDGEGQVSVEISEIFTMIYADDKIWGLWIYEENNKSEGGGSTSKVIVACAESIGKPDGGLAIDGLEPSQQDPQTASQQQQQPQPQLPTLNHATAYHQTQQLPSPSPSPSPETHPPPQPSQISPPDIPVAQPPPSLPSHPSISAPTKTQTLPRFTPSADTQFFLSQGRGGSQQISRNRPPAASPAANGETEKGADVLGALFAKAKNEFLGKGKL